MRKSLFLALFTLLCGARSFGATITAKVLSGLWTSASSWNPSRVPVHGDTVLIPVSSTIIVDRNLNYSSSGFHVKIYGKLKMANPASKLTTSPASQFIVHTGGVIEATGNPSETIIIGANRVYRGDQGPVIGPQIATVTTSGFEFYNEFKPLAVTFIGFTLDRQQQDDILVRWSTSEETNAAYYELERSFDRNNWNKVAYVIAAGNARSVNHYEYRDRQVTARTVYYRLRQVDMDGRFTYTSIKTIQNSETAAAGISIAAAGSKVMVRFPEAVNGPVTVRLISMNGQVAAQQTFSQASGQVVMTAAASLRGIYTVSVANGRDLHTAQKVIF